MHKINAIGRKELAKILLEQNLKDALIVDSYNGAPYNMDQFKFFNPFYTWPSPCIPVPGLKDGLSSSVEAIWQGTKWIKGKTDYQQFLSTPYKRPSEEERKRDKQFSYSATQFVYGETILSHLEARFLIYIISYLYLLDRLVPNELLNYIRKMIDDNKQIIFCDWDDNVELTNVNESFSHSSLLASWYKGTLENDFLLLAEKSLSQKYYMLFESQFCQLINRYKQLNR